MNGLTSGIVWILDINYILKQKHRVIQLYEKVNRASYSSG